MSKQQIQHTPLPKPGFMLRRIGLSAHAVALGVSLALAGYTALLILAVNISGSIETSRLVTVPLRLVIVMMLCVAFVLAPRSVRHPAILFFLAFGLLYVLRIGIEWTGEAQSLYQLPVEFLLYFLSFVAAPFLLLAFTRFVEHSYSVTVWWLLIAISFFAILTLIYYGEYVGEAGRIAVSMEENYISPLALSYDSALGMALIAVLWVQGSGLRLPKAYLAALFLALLVPFFLGASRGSVVALGLVAAFFLMFRGDSKHRFGLLLLLGIGVGVAWLAQEHLGSGVFTRMTDLQSDIETGASSAIRLVMWRDGIEQFWSAPIFGSSLQLNTFPSHPHNMFIEVAISTGILGLVMFCGFLLAIFKSAIEIVRRIPERSWVVVVFLMGFVSNLFSGSISFASMMAIGAGLIIATVVPAVRPH